MKKILIFGVFVSLLGCTGTKKTNYALLKPGAPETEIIEKAANIIPTARQLRWQQLELTAFFHFGINTFTGREWGDGKEDPRIFNPAQLNAEQWIQTAKAAGIKQVIITAKHHDGFCLWPTKTTLHSVKSSPWKNGSGDVLKEVANACKKYNIGFGVYLSPWDRNAPVYGTDAYNDFFVQQLTELLTWYGKVDEVWFDGANGEGPNGKKQVYDFNRWYQLIRKLQPQAVIAIMGPDVRWVGTETGMGRPTEWSVVPTNNLDQASIAAGSQKDLTFKPMGDLMGEDLGSREKIINAKGLVWYPAETDVSIRPGWFYHAEEDAKVKSVKQLNDIYFTSIGMNSVLLLNIPPDRNGLINAHDVKRLQEWSASREAIFSNNLAGGSKVFTPDGKGAQKVVDGNYKTYFTTKGANTKAMLEMRLPSTSSFNVLSVQENIKVGQRVEKFSFHYWDGDNWKEFARGTTIGYKRLLKFPTIKADKVKLVIESSRLNPTIAEIGLFNAPEN